MKRVKIADLKNNLSRHLLYVRDGGELLVLDRDTPIARVVAFAPAESPDARPARAGREEYWTPERLARMEQQGIIARGGARAAQAWAKGLRAVKLPAGTPSAVDELLRTRRESTR